MNKKRLLMRHCLFGLLTVLICTAGTARGVTAVSYYVDPDATGTGIGTSWTNAFTSLNAFNSLCLNLVVLDQIVTVYCRSSGGTADTVAARIDYVGENKWILDPTHTITITVADSNEHSGIWNDSMYRLIPTDASPAGQCALFLGISNLIVDGLQIDAGSLGANGSGIRMNNTITEEGDTKGDIIVRNCIIRNAQSTEEHIWSRIYKGRSNYIYNNIIYGTIGFGIQLGDDDVDETTGTFYVYNNTISGVKYGIDVQDLDTEPVITNNLMASCVTKGFQDLYDWTNTYTTATNYTSDATSPDGAEYQNATITFVGAADFHLAPAMSGTLLGTDLSATFTTDIDGDTRSSWYAGADELKSEVGRSRRPLKRPIGVGIGVGLAGGH